MAYLRLWWRMMRIAVHLCSGCVQLALLGARQQNVVKQRRIQHWSRQLLQLCGVQWHCQGILPARMEAGQLWVANHVSWLDIFVINAICPVRFVAKADIQTWPLIGWLVARADTVFIRREQRQHTNHALNTMQQALQQGDIIGLFPEGTSTNGQQVKPFKASLFQAAIDAQISVQPLAIEYLTLQGERNAAPAYYDDISLWHCLQQILLQPQSHVHVYALPAIASTNATRQQLAHTSHQYIANIIHAPSSVHPVNSWQHDNLPIHINPAP